MAAPLESGMASKHDKWVCGTLIIFLSKKNKRNKTVNYNLKSHWHYANLTFSSALPLGGGWHFSYNAGVHIYYYPKRKCNLLIFQKLCKIETLLYNRKPTGVGLFLLKWANVSAPAYRNSCFQAWLHLNVAVESLAAFRLYTKLISIRLFL